VGFPWLVALVTTLVFGAWGGVMSYFTSQMPDIGEISATNWFLSRAIPTTITAIAIGGTIAWASWVHLQNAPVTAIIGLATALMWGAVMYFYIHPFA
jgi:hypothetical protein